ncbi:N-formylglutamate amidohydrolase [Dokdonella sp.]|uniref:N-formylglutamate amidohydrolase n=1 Tax=Dokdonella sp. TaxID=2291710 RepID=UPI0035293F56
MAVDTYTAPFHVQTGGSHAFLVLCDHASNAIPESYNALGMRPCDLERHIAWDIGARGVSLELAKRMDCPAVLGGSSRLLIDLNRDIDDSGSIVAENDNTFVPGNLSVSDEERALRVRHFYAPYHAHIEAMLDELLARRVKPVVISVHSFNRMMGGIERPWQVAVLWSQAREPIVPLIEWFAGQGFQVGENQPYDARILGGHTIEQHAMHRQLPHVIFEIRNDEIATPQQQQAWGQRLHRAIIETRFGRSG